MKRMNVLRGFLRCVCVSICICFCGNMYGHFGTHYGYIHLEAKPTGGGKVYVTTSTTTPSAASSTWETTADADFDCGGFPSGNDANTKNYYAWAAANDGYWFEGWSTDSYTILSNSKVNCYGPITATIDNTINRYARFKPVTVASIATFQVEPTALRTLYTKEIAFPVSGENIDLADFQTPTIESTVGDGTWELVQDSWRIADGKFYVKFTYEAKRDTYKNTANNHTDKAKVTVTSVGDTEHPATCDIEATFGVTINDGSSDPVTMVHPADGVATYIDGQATFTVDGFDEKEDFKLPTFSEETDGIWEVRDYTYAKEKKEVTVDYRYTPSASATVGSYTAKMTLASNLAGFSEEGSCTLQANVRAAITGGDAGTTLTPTPTQTSISGIATFTVQYAKDASPFTAEFDKMGGTAGGGWTVDLLSYANGVLTVSYTFTHLGTEGKYTAQLKLTTDGDSETIDMQAVVEAPVTADEHVEVTVPGQTPVRTTWAEGLVLANNAEGSTIRLLQNVDLGTLAVNHTISKTMTLDLNGKILTAALATDYTQLLVVDEVGKTLTITDGLTGGTLRATSERSADKQSAICVRQGNLVLEKGTIEATYTTSKTNTFSGVYLAAANASFTMNSGTLVATHTTGEAVRGIEAVAGSQVTINAGTIDVTAKTKAYGVYSYGKVTVTGGTIEAEATGATANGIYMNANEDAVAANCSYGKLNMTGGTVNVTAGSSARGVYLNATNGIVTTNAPDGTHTNKAAAVATIQNATIHATATGTNGGARGVYVKGCYNSLDNTITPTILERVTIRTTATKISDGVYDEVNVNATHGAKRWAQFELRDCDIASVATTGGEVYAVHLGAAQAAITASNAWTGEENAAASSAVIIGGTYTATAKTSTAYGIFMEKTQVGATGQASACGSLTVQGATVSATSQTSNTVYGIQTSGVTEIDDCEISATAEKGSDKVQGVYIYDNKTKLTNSTVTAIGKGTVRGVYVDATISSIGWECVGALESENNHITATTNTDNSAYGLYLHATQSTTTPAGEHAVAAVATSVNDTYTVSTGGSEAVGVYAAKKAITAGGNAEAYPQVVLNKPTVHVTSGKEKAYGIRTGGKTVIDNGMFTVNTGATDARGCYVESGDVTATNTTLTVTAATGKAYGLTAEASIVSNIQKEERPVITLNTVNITATTTAGDVAYGVYTKGTTSGEKVAFPAVTIAGGKYVAKAQGSTAYGILTYDLESPSMGSAAGTAFGGTALNVRNATIEATAQTTKDAFGLRVNGPTEIDNCKITATATTTSAYGLYVYTDKTKLTRSTITAMGTGEVYGTYLHAEIGNTGCQYVGDLTSENNTIMAEATNGDKAYGLYLEAAATSAANVDYAVAASASLTNDVWDVFAPGKTAYAVGMKAKQTKNSATAAPMCTIHSGKFRAEASSDVADIDANGVLGNVVVENGYFFAKTNVEKYLATGKALLNTPTSSEEHKARFFYVVGNASAPAVFVCKIGSTEYYTLEEALQVVKSGQTIVMTNNYTLPAGNYVLPAGTTLLVPYNSSQTSIKGTSPSWLSTWQTPSEYLRLTFASGVNFTAQGNIEVSGALNKEPSEMPNNVIETNIPGETAGPYGRLHIEKDAHVDLESGVSLYAWGYITGKGLINAKNGVIVYEGFQMGDWKGGAITKKMNDDAKAFPLTHYFYQNIECPIVYRPGAKAYGNTNVDTSMGDIKADDILLVGVAGSGALFLMDPATAGENVWVRKEYDPTTDRTHWVVNSDVTLGSLNIGLSGYGYSIDSKKFALPLSSNMTITLNSGQLSMEQDAYLMPGTVLNINKEAVLQIPEGKSLYLVDKDQWLHAYSVGYSTFYVHTTLHSPSWEGTVSPRAYLKSNNAQLPDAEIFVHGAIEVMGNLFTTAGGANIHSTNADAGKVTFISPWTNNTGTWSQFKTWETSGGLLGSLTGEGTVFYKDNPVTSAQLRNEKEVNGSYYTQTTDAQRGYSFNYIDGEWVAFTNECLSTKISGDGIQQYANPSDMVEVTEGPDNTYQSMDGQRLFINTEGATDAATCVWWEVKNDGIGYYASDKAYTNYGGYYEYTADGYWAPVMVNVTWTGEGMTTTTYPVHKGTAPIYLGADPVRSGYKWTGWTDGTTPHDRNATLPVATAETTTYTTTWVESEIKHTIIFKDADGSLIEAGLWKEGTIPTCPDPDPIMTVSTIETFKAWSPTPVAVTKPTTYTATYNTPTPRMYPIHFLNADGTEIYVEDVAHGTTPIYRGVTPTRESNTAYSYEFNGKWQSSTGATGLAAVSGEEWYTAQFNAIEREYGDWLDVVDASASTLTLNMNGYSSASAGTGWTITVGENSYTKVNRAADRTLAVALPAGVAADDKVVIVTKGKDGVVEARRRYTVPHVYTADATLSAVAEDYSSVIYVQSGTLTVASNATVAAIYVAPGAELKINSGVTLAVAKLVLRTEAFSSAVLTDNGRLKANKVYYSRIARDRTQFYPIALPFDVTLNDVTLSHGGAAVLGKNFGLMYFDSEQRANGGTTQSNWKNMDATAKTMQAHRAYQLLSTSAYYSEYYFPVSYTPDAANATVAVGAYTGAAAEGHWGFNAVCSPYTKEYVCNYTDIAEAVKISVLNTDNKTYTQKTADKIAPATMFFYQAKADGVLSFGSNVFEFVPAATRSIVARRTPQSVSSAQTQWIQLEYGAADGHVDETNIYLHPDKFTDTYDLGYDLQKLSTSGGLPFIWTSAAYGDLAFAALPDTVATQGIALSMYAPAAGEMMLNLVDNVWMSRLEALYLMDKQADVQVDLLHNDYTWMAEAGTSTGRFYLYPILRKPDAGDVVTDVPSQMETEAMVAYAIERQVVVEHVPIGSAVRCYDATGKLVTSCTAEREQVVLNVPASGMYLIHADNGMCKVMVNE